MASPSPKPNLIYSVHRIIPTSPSFPKLASLFSELRLRALITSAASFSSTYELESTFNPEKWQTRLSRPGVHTFVAVAYPPNTPLEHQTIENGEWVGKVTLLGPTCKDVYELQESGGPTPASDEEETKWQMTALYSEPAHRGKGLGKKIIEGALEFARSYNDSTHNSAMNGVTNGVQPARKPKQIRVRIMIHPDNTVVVKMYQDLGFVDAGKCTLREAYVTNGDANLLPEGGGDPKRYYNRRGLVMEILRKTT
jgi:GNAT superfamily N-acetyltransferase